MEQNEKESAILEFFELLEKEIDVLQFGTITITVPLTRGVPNVGSFSLVKSKKRKYTEKKNTEYVDSQRRTR